MTAHQLYTQPMRIVFAAHLTDLDILEKIMLFHVSLQPRDTQLLAHLEDLRDYEQGTSLVSDTKNIVV